MRTRDLLARALRYAAPATDDLNTGIGLDSQRLEQVDELPLRAGRGIPDERAWSDQLAEDDTLTYGEAAP